MSYHATLLTQLLRDSHPAARICRAIYMASSCAVAILVLKVVPGYSQETDRDKSDQKNVAAFTDDDLQQRWNKLTKAEAAEVARRHIHGLVRAAHLYHEAHGSFPPAVVPNRNVPAGKQLSGLVLLLPYLRAASWLEKDKPCFDSDVVKHAENLYKSIDLKKAWDAPVNLKAAKTIVPAFFAPQSGAFRDENGLAVTHFALVQGSSGGRDGAFPGEEPIEISGITDGTVSTLAIGQIAHDLGPWIAEGLSTARQVHPRTEKEPGTFGSLYHNSGAYFAMCDSTPSFFVFDRTSFPALDKLATRAGGEIVVDGLKRKRNPFEK